MYEDVMKALAGKEVGPGALLEAVRARVERYSVEGGGAVEKTGTS